MSTSFEKVTSLVAMELVNINNIDELLIHILLPCDQ